MTVADLIAQLQDFMPSDEVVATWEGVVREVSVYPGADGVVVLDADGDEYRHHMEGHLRREDNSVGDIWERRRANVP